MTLNKGKQFESIVKKSFEKEEDTYVLRLYDTTNGFIGIANPCDFVVYKHSRLFLIECKTCHGSSLPLANISSNQWNSLLEASNIDGIIAGYMIWFIDKDTTIFLQAQDAELYVKQTNKKSIPYNIPYAKQVLGNKKRVFYEYDMKGVLNGTY